MKAFVAIASLGDLPSAEELLSSLQAGGIKAEIIDEGATEKIPAFVPRKINYRVRVAREQVEAGREVLKRVAPKLGSLFVCPQCNGSRIEFPQLTRRFLGPYLIFGLLSRIGLMQPQFYCQDCHLTWDLPEAES